MNEKMKKPWYKKVWVWVLVVIAVFILIPTGGSDEPVSEEPETTVVDTAAAASETTEVEPTESEVVEEVEEAEELDIVLNDFVIAKDYEGKPCFIILASWTNTTDDTTMFSTTYGVSTFQDGIGLEMAIVLDDNYTDMINAQLTEIRPGATIDVAIPFEMRNETSAIEIEVDEWISFDNEVLISTIFEPAE